MTERVKAGQAIVDVLKAEGVKAVFGMPGGHVLGIYDALYHAPEIKSYLVRHEQQAPALATGYFQLTGELAVCLVTAGPGATNLLTSVAEAFVGSIPMVLLAGRGATATSLRGASQEIRTDLVFAPVTKWTIRVDRADLLVDAMHQAFAVARNGKPGPVLVDMPRDLLAEDVERKPYVPVGAPNRPRGDSAAIARAADALIGAGRPIIVAGGGVIASGAAGEVQALAERLAIPVLTSLAGRGTIPDDHPLSVGGLGVHRNDLSKRLLREADVVLGLGTRFEEMETNWRSGFVPAPEAVYIQVDIDPVEIGRSVPAQLSVVGDIGHVARALAELIDVRAPARGDFRAHERTRACQADIARITAHLDELAAGDQAPLHPLRVIRAARGVFPRDATIAIDVGCLAQHMAGGFPVFPVYQQRSLIAPSSFYGMGFASMALPAARIARPDHPAMGFVGDGAFQMVMPILPLAADYRLGVTWIILNDHALGSIRDIQEIAFGNRILDTDLTTQPDFAKLAQACGCYGETIHDPDAVVPALQRAYAANRAGQPAVLDFTVARERLQSTYDHYLFYQKALA